MTKGEKKFCDSLQQLLVGMVNNTAYYLGNVSLEVDEVLVQRQEKDIFAVVKVFLEGEPKFLTINGLNTTFNHIVFGERFLKENKQAELLTFIFDLSKMLHNSCLQEGKELRSEKTQKEKILMKELKNMSLAKINRLLKEVEIND